LGPRAMETPQCASTVHPILVIPGDGIGPEIMNATLRVLRFLEGLCGRFKLSFEIHEAGASSYLRTGKAMPDETADAFERCKVALKGPVGLPCVRTREGTEAGLLGGILRVGFDLYANVRPIRHIPGVPSPLGEKGDLIDYVIVRENTEGLYLSRGKGLRTEQAAVDNLLLTRRGCERISRFAFQLASKKREGAPEDGNRRVTLVEKSNVLVSFAFFKDIFLQVAGEFPNVAHECMYVDAAASALVTNPEHFQVIVTENMFGDILSDLGGATVGGLGFCPSANIGEGHAYFEPIHGSAPHIAGKDLANPTGLILSASMMLDYLGEREAAKLLEKGVSKAWSKGKIKVEKGGIVPGGARLVAEAVMEALEEVAKGELATCGS